jgi:hypothetical protein
MGLKASFLGCINGLIKLKVPVNAQFKDTSTFLSNVDKLEELNLELMELKKKALQIKTEVDTKQAAMEKFISAIEAKTGEYDKARESVLKVMQKDKNSEGAGLCSGMGVALNQIEGYIKASPGLKFSVEVK